MGYICIMFLVCVFVIMFGGCFWYLNILELFIVMYMYYVFVEVISSSFIDISILKLILLKIRKIFWFKRWKYDVMFCYLK